MESLELSRGLAILPVERGEHDVRIVNAKMRAMTVTGVLRQNAMKSKYVSGQESIC